MNVYDDDDIFAFVVKRIRYLGLLLILIKCLSFPMQSSQILLFLIHQIGTPPSSR